MLGQNLQGQLSSEGMERDRCQPRSQSRMVRDRRTAQGRAGLREQAQSQEGGTAQRGLCPTQIHLHLEL